MTDRVPEHDADGQDLTSSGPKYASPADVAVGICIAGYRKAHGLSQAALGKAIGVTNVQIKKYEVGADRVTAGRLSKIAEFLGVSITDLYGDEAVKGDKTLDLLSTPGAIDLLSTFAEIQDPDIRRALVKIAKSTARRRTTSS